MFKKILLVLLTFSLISCNRINTNNAEKYIKTIELYDKIEYIYLAKDRYVINKTYYNNSNENIPSDIFDSIEMTQQGFRLLINIFKSTNAIGIDKNKDGQYYFIESGFLDDNYGILYSPSTLPIKDTFTEDDRIHFGENYILGWKHKEGNWYKAYGGN